MTAHSTSLMFVDITTGDVTIATGENTWPEYVPITGHYISPLGETDEDTEKFYIARLGETALYSWEDFFNENVLRSPARSSADYYPSVWVSKPYIVPPEIDFVSARVIANGYPVTVQVAELNPDDFSVVKVTEYSVKSREPFRLKSVRRGYCVSFAFIELRQTVYRIEMVSATGEFR